MLYEKLNALYERAQLHLPEETLDTMKRGTQSLVHSDILSHTIKAGDRMPNFELQNALGQTVTLDALLAQGPVVINFYRGGWCPYCNLELNAYQEILDKIHEKGAQLVAITPEKPDGSLKSTESLNLGFEILSDIDNHYAKSLGIVFKLSNELVSVYKGIQIDLVASQGNENAELPIPGTFVIDRDGTVKLAHLDVDYTKRFEPEDVLKYL